MSGEFDERAMNSLAGFQCLLRIEAVLRQLIAEELERFAGSKWHKQRLPQDVFKKIQEGQAYERAYRWYEFIPHHPIAYIDFPDLRKIILREDNWRDVFARFFQNKDRFQSQGKDLDFVRNKIAHSRLLTADEADVIRQFESEIRNCVGGLKCDDLLSRYAPIGNIPSQLQAISSALSDLSSHVARLDIIDLSPALLTVHQNWWFDDDFIPINTQRIFQCIQMLQEYQRQPRIYREGYKLEAWVREQGLSDLIVQCTDDLAASLEKRNQ